MEDPDWVAATKEELDNFTCNKVWSLVERPKGRCQNIIGTKWVYKNKQDEHGKVITNNARLVAQGFTKVQTFNLGEPLCH